MECIQTDFCWVASTEDAKIVIYDIGTTIEFGMILILLNERNVFEENPDTFGKENEESTTN